MHISEVHFEISRKFWIHTPQIKILRRVKNLTTYDILVLVRRALGLSNDMIESIDSNFLHGTQIIRRSVSPRQH